jgi:hypothetical protein
MKSEHDESIKDMFHGYLNGTLTREAAALLKEHLSGCDECAAELHIVGALLKLEVPDPGDSYFNSLTGAVLDSARAAAPGKFHLWRDFFIRPVPIAAAASLCLMIYLVIFNFGGHSPMQLYIGDNTAKNMATDIFSVSVSDDMMDSLEEEYGDAFSSGYAGGEYLAMAL